MFSKNESDLTKEDLERRRVQRELNREHKWLEMLEEWKRRHPVKLPERIWKGVPEKLRIAVGAHFSTLVFILFFSFGNDYWEWTSCEIMRALICTMNC